MITFSNIPESVQRTLFDRMDMLDRNSLKTKIGDPISVEAGQPKINYMNGRSVFMRMISLQPPTNVKPVILSGGESDYKGNLVNNNWGNKKFTHKSAVYGEVGVDVGPPHMRMLEPASRLEDIVHGKYDSSGEQPYRPMPGVKDISIEFKGGGRTLAATREAIINWTCWTWQDLDRLTGHFLHHGRTVFIDWGWSGIGEIDPLKVIPFPILVKDEDGELELVESLTTNRAGKLVPLLSTLPDHIIEQRGNYDAMIGIVKDFEWSVRDDGGFDCVTTLLSTGVNILQQSLKTASDPRLASLPMLIESDAVEDFKTDELLDREGLAVAATGALVFKGAATALGAQLITGTIIEPISTIATAGALVGGLAMVGGGLFWDYAKREDKKWIMPTLIGEFDKMNKEAPRGEATSMDVDKSLILGMTRTDEAFVSYPKGEAVISKLAPYINFDHYIKDLYNQLHWNLSTRNDILQSGHIIRVSAPNLGAAYIEKKDEIKQTSRDLYGGTKEYYFDEMYVTWGWFEDNVLSRFFSRVIDSGNGVMGEFRSYEESPLPADDIPAQSNEPPKGGLPTVNIPVRIRNHPKMMSTDLTKFMLMKGDAVEKFVENQWGKGWIPVDGKDGFFMNINIGEMPFNGNLIPSGEDKVVLHQFDYIDPESEDKNESWGVLRNVYFNARHLTEMMQDATSIEDAILSVWNDFSNEYGGIYDFYLDFSDDQNRIIVKDRGWTQDDVRDRLDNKSHMLNPDGVDGNGDDEANFNGLFEFPTWEKNSIVKSQTLSARLPDRMKLVSMYGSSNLTAEEVSGLGDYNEQAGLAWGKLVAPIDASSDMDGLTPEQYKQRQLDAVIAGKVEFPWRRNRSFGSPTADINKELHIKKVELNVADTDGVRMTDTIIGELMKKQYSEYLQDAKQLAEDTTGKELGTDEAAEKASKMKETIKKRKAKWQDLQKKRVGGSSNPQYLFSNFYQASTEERQGGPIAENKVSTPRGFKLLNTFKQFMLKDIRGEDGITNKFDPIIPLDFDLEIDGTAGIYPGNAFQSSYLPEKYKDIACFQAVGVDHKVDSTGWTSTVKGQIRVSISKQNELLGKGKGKESGQKPAAETDGDKVKDTVAPSIAEQQAELSKTLQELDAMRQAEFDELMANATVVATEDGIVPPPSPPTLKDTERTSNFGLGLFDKDPELGDILTGEFEGKISTTLYGEGGPVGLNPGDAKISSNSTPGGVTLTIDEYVTDPDKASEIAATAVNSLVKDYLPPDIDQTDLESLYSDVYNQMTDSTRAGSTIVVTLSTIPNPIITPGVTSPIFNYTPPIFDTSTTRNIQQPPLIFDDTGGG